ncbi:MAG TPA: LLM class flavin-dependent oxidoreductase [Hyphomicrobiales bacterium]|nr:LLM class flavin-dependent oxidoreductase [Hyphomicrobiales bacterium]
MQVFVFDLLQYGKNLDHLRENGHLPFPMLKKYFEPEVAVRTYAEHLDAWVELERQGFDGVAFNEHHVTPYGMMNSPNLLAASAAQRTSKLKLLMYANLLPLHDPLRLAEEIAMLDCLSNGRIICGVARGAPREYKVFGIPMAESRARFDECYDIMRGAWTEETFTYEGRFHSYDHVAIWPRPVQQPHPPVWVPITGSKDSIEWAAANDIPITPARPGAAREDVIRYYAECLAKRGRRMTPDMLSVGIDCYIADSREQAIAEYAPYAIYFHALFSLDHEFYAAAEAKGYYAKDSTAHFREGVREVARDDSLRARDLTIDDVRKQAENGAFGSPDEVARRIVEIADQTGAGTVLLSMNRGAMPHEMFMRQIQRFGAEVLPRLQAHRVTRVPLAETAAA